MPLEEGNAIPNEISWEMNIPKPGSKVTLLETGEKLDWKLKDGKATILLPKSLQNKNTPALAFSFKE
jgi:alpha-L-fucosidase